MPREQSKCREWEKERRNRLNEAFSILCKLLPCYDPSVNTSKIDILRNAAGYIQELQTKVQDLTSGDKEDLSKKENDEVRKLQERLKRLLSKNEQLCALLRDAKITIPNGCSLIKKFKFPKYWSNRIPPEQAKILQKNESEKENDARKGRKLITKTKTKVGGQGGTPKHRKAILNRPDSKKIRSSKKKKLKPLTSSKCVIVLSQSSITQPCYVITNAPSNNNILASTSTVITNNSALVTNPLVTSKTAKTVASVPPLGPGTLILTNGTIMPVLPQQTVLPLTPQIIARPPPIILLPRNPATTTTTATATSASVTNNKIVSSGVKTFPRIRPKYCFTKTTQVNKVPIPALTSRYSNPEVVLLKKPIKTKIIEKKKESETKPECGEKRKVTESDDSTEEKKAKVAEQPTVEEKETTPEVSLPSSDEGKKQEEENNKTNEVENKENENQTRSQPEGAEKKKPQESLELSMNHSELSNDIFASLQVPSGCQNPESTSPTAAFLLAFPLVSSLTGVKVTEVPEEENDSQRGTPTLLQIGTLNTTKTTQSESLTPSILNLDNLSFFSSKDINGFYSTFDGNIATSTSTSTTVTTALTTTITTTTTTITTTITNTTTTTTTTITSSTEPSTTSTTSVTTSNGREQSLQKSLEQSAPPNQQPIHQQPLEHSQKKTLQPHKIQLQPPQNSQLSLQHQQQEPQKNLHPPQTSQKPQQQTIALQQKLQHQQPQHQSLQQQILQKPQHHQTLQQPQQQQNLHQSLQQQKPKHQALHHSQQHGLHQTQPTSQQQGLQQHPLQQQNMQPQQQSLQKTQPLQHPQQQQKQPMHQDKNQLVPCFENHPIPSFGTTNATNTVTQQLSYQSKNHDYASQKSFLCNNFNELSKVTITCSYGSTTRSYPEPLYTNSGTYTYGSSSDLNLNQNYYKDISKSDNRSYYSLNYENYTDYRKNEATNNSYFTTSNYYYPKEKFANINNSKNKNGSQSRLPINWMTTSSDYVLPQFAKEPEFYPTNTQTAYPMYSNEVATTQAKSLDLPLVPPVNTYQRNEVEENQFSWSPTKIPQFLDPPHSFVSSTLPTLVGDLALGNPVGFGEQKNDKCQKKDRRLKNFENNNNTSSSTSNNNNNNSQSNFLSVSQLVDHNKEVPARTTTRRNSGNRSSGKKVVPKTNQRKDTKDVYTHNNNNNNNNNNNKVEDNTNAKGLKQQIGYSSEVFCESSNKNRTKTSYSAEALIGQMQPDQNQKNYSSNKPLPVSSFLHDNIIPYFPTVDLPQDNTYIQQNQNYQTSTFNHNFSTTFQNNTYIPPATTITSSYNFMHEVSHDYSDNLNLFPQVKEKNCPKNPNRTGREQQCPMTPKKPKRKHSNELPGFVDFPFLSMPGSINSPILPDDFHSHSGFLQPPNPQLYPCKNPFTKPNDLTSASLLPLPPVPVTRSNIQHPEISPSINSAGTSLTNFNLSTIFPEINNKSILPDPYAESRNKEHARSYSSSVQVPFNDKPTFSFSYINCATSQSYNNNQ